MRPVVVCENMGTETASTRQTMPKTRMPFNGERIRTSKREWNIFLVDTHTTEIDEPSAIGRYTLTRPTRQVVLWSDHQTAPAQRLLAGNLDNLGQATQRKG